MKFKITLISLFSILTIFIFQNLAFSFDFGLGIKVGTGGSFYTGDDWDYFLSSFDADNSSKLSLSLGLTMDMNFYQGNVFGFGLQTDFQYVLNGGAYEIAGFRFEHTYHTFEIPLYLKPRFKTGKGYFFFLAGPDILLSLDNEMRSDIVEGGHFSIKYKLDNAYSIGMSAGLGYEIKFGPGELILYLNYSTYFTGFGNGTNLLKKMYLNMVYLNAAYTFYIAKPNNE